MMMIMIITPLPWLLIYYFCVVFHTLFIRFRFFLDLLITTFLVILFSLLRNGFYYAAVDEIISGNPIFLSLVFPVTPYQSFVFVHWITSLVFNVAVIMMKSTFNYIVEPWWWWWWWSNLVIIITIHWVQCFYYDDIHCRLDIISFFQNFNLQLFW